MTKKSSNPQKDTKQEFKVSKEGSLGLLALGDIGLKLWREAKNKEKDN